MLIPKRTQEELAYQGLRLFLHYIVNQKDDRYRQYVIPALVDAVKYVNGDIDHWDVKREHFNQVQYLNDEHAELLKKLENPACPTDKEWEDLYVAVVAKLYSPRMVEPVISADPTRELLKQQGELVKRVKMVCYNHMVENSVAGSTIAFFMNRCTFKQMYEGSYFSFESEYTEDQMVTYVWSDNDGSAFTFTLTNDLTKVIFNQLS